MSLSEHQLAFGYWPSRQLSGDIPHPIRHPDQYDGSDTLNLACTQTGLPAREQRNLIATWCSILPELPVRTIVFSSKVNQGLFDAAARNAGLEALFVKWSSVESIESLADHTALSALYLGSSPSLTGLRHLASLRELRHLFVVGARESADLGYARALSGLVEFGLSGSGQPLVVDSLEPLGALHELAIMWLVRVRVRHGGLKPLHALRQLKSFRTSLDLQSREVVELREAVPALQHLQPVR